MTNYQTQKKEEIIRIIKKYRDTEYLNVAAEEINKAILLENATKDTILSDFIQECERMISLYKNKRYTQAEELRDKLAEKLDDVMRG